MLYNSEKNIWFSYLYGYNQKYLYKTTAKYLVVKIFLVFLLIYPTTLTWFNVVTYDKSI